MGDQQPRMGIAALNNNVTMRQTTFVIRLDFPQVAIQADDKQSFTFPLQGSESLGSMLVVCFRSTVQSRSPFDHRLIAAFFRPY
jgi:hypothetical protein